jgi:orotidine-5'-phosphate decarboxylase
VCSAADVQAIREHLPSDFLYVTPGIQGLDMTAGTDQKRVFTSRRAIQAGASILVVGRAITAAPDRAAAACEILQDLVNAEKVDSAAAV